MTRITVRRALLSAADKTGLDPLARGLMELGVTLVSTGGTARLLREAGLPVQEVSDVTGQSRQPQLQVRMPTGLAGAENMSSTTAYPPEQVTNEGTSPPHAGDAFGDRTNDVKDEISRYNPYLEAVTYTTLGGLAGSFRAVLNDGPPGLGKSLLREGDHDIRLTEQEISRILQYTTTKLLEISRTYNATLSMRILERTESVFLFIKQFFGTFDFDLGSKLAEAYFTPADEPDFMLKVLHENGGEMPIGQLATVLSDYQHYSVRTAYRRIQDAIESKQIRGNTRKTWLVPTVPTTPNPATPNTDPKEDKK